MSVLVLQDATDALSVDRFRECSVCHQPFIPDIQHPNQKCCSKKCNNKAYNEAHKFKVQPLECVICHKIFTPKRKLKGEPCCSEKCLQAHHYQRNQVRKLRYRKEHYVPKIRAPQKCKRCGAVFQPTQDGPLPIYCSDYCSKLAWKEAHKDQVEEYFRTHRVELLERARKRRRIAQDTAGFSNPGTVLRLKTMEVRGQERVADAVFLEQQLGRKRPKNSESPKASWRWQGEGSHVRS